MAVLHTEDREDDFVIIDLTHEEYVRARRQALDELGLSYEQLAEQARRRDFSSPDARSLWLRIKPVRPQEDLQSGA
ncbi:hypothetical protein GCM10014719_37740 [Planomonospora parontospora subsp. antibiotica]|nr:hypothetical protein GCM10014719_37740 [Planomonospora parontospora subsp. antibiotica]GII17002.1 hypothetical protein Ppa05_37280 [Planomonospora parontospora subsp. antibiotica]